MVAELRPAYQPFCEPQTLVVRLVECGDEATALFLLEQSENNGLGEASIGVSVGPLLCLTVASKSRQGIRKYETTERLPRFAQSFRETLRAAERTL